MATIRAGVVGVGRMGAYHLGVLSEIAEVSIIGIVDTDLRRAEALSKQYSIPHFSNYKDLINKADVAIVAVPTSAHYPVARDLLCLLHHLKSFRCIHLRWKYCLRKLHRAVAAAEVDA